MIASARLRDIRNDRVSGSAKITGDTCEFIRESLMTGASSEEIEGALREILDAHRPMALLHNCIRHFLNGGRPDDFLREMREKNRKASEIASRYLKEKGIGSVITISSSSLVESALSNFDGRIYAMESRPMLEGTAMAERLMKKGRDVTVVADAYGISMAAKGKADAVMVGADALITGTDALHKNTIINKVGTYALSVSAEKSGIEFMVVLTTDKIFPDNVELSEDEIMQFHDPKEITERAKAINPYFETVPIREGMMVLSEEGEMDVERRGSEA